jgi:aspartate ammonia-lyase
MLQKKKESTISSGYRIEKDSLGVREIPKEAYWGINTLRAIENFPITGLKSHSVLIDAYVLIKMAAARVNSELGFIDIDKAEAIVKACNEILEGNLRDQFVVDAINSGAGTSLHMNINEVVANRALEIMDYEKGEYSYVHPNDDVNKGQSSNDVTPSAIKIAVAVLLEKLLPVLETLKAAFEKKGSEFDHILKSGRTHMQDAVPIRLGQEFSAYAETVNKSVYRLKEAEKSICQLNLGATAVGTGLNAHSEYKEKVIEELRSLTGLPLKSSPDLIEATHNIDNFLDVACALKILAAGLIQIANDLRLLSSGPLTGFAEITLPEVQAGSSIMPGKVNPVLPEMLNMVCFHVFGTEEIVSMAVQAGQLEMNVMTPVIGFNLLFTLDTLRNAIDVFTKKCVEGISADEERCEELAEISTGIATALTPYIGYENAAMIAKEAYKTGKTVRQIAKEKKVLTDDQLDKILSPKSMT